MPTQIREKHDDGVVVLFPPKLTEVDAGFREILGKKETDNFIQREYVNDYFNTILEYVRQRFGDRKVGVRTILCALEPGKKAKIASRYQPIEIATIESILERGGELEELRTLITRFDMAEEDGSPQTDMSEEYLLFATKAALESESPGKVLPAVLVYDLAKTQDGHGQFEVVFPDKEAKREALVGVYPIDIRPLQNLDNKDI